MSIKSEHKKIPVKKKEYTKMNNKIYQYKKKCFIKIKSIQIMRKKNEYKN